MDEFSYVDGKLETESYDFAIALRFLGFKFHEEWDVETDKMYYCFEIIKNKGIVEVINDLTKARRECKQTSLSS